MAGIRIVVLWAACASSLSCGGYYFVGFVSNPGGATSITGVVVALSNGFVADPSGVTQSTAVTFLNAGSKTTLNFCGDQQRLFPIEATVRADYTAGILCSVLVRVVVDNERAQLESHPDTSKPEHFGLKQVNFRWSRHNA